MHKRTSKDENETAFSIVENATAETKKKKNPAAVSLGRLGGLKGGRARAEKLSDIRRQEIAQKAAMARWRKK
jgi:hypothetical protein